MRGEILCECLQFCFEQKKTFFLQKYKMHFKKSKEKKKEPSSVIFWAVSESYEHSGEWM